MSDTSSSSDPGHDDALRGAIVEDLLALARRDARVSAAATIGSLARGEADAWSDVDLTFAVDDEDAGAACLDEWQAHLDAVHGCTRLFDVAAGTSSYRVLLLACGLQVDLSVTPARDFGPRGGGAFEVHFGAVAREHPVTAASRSRWIGLAVHHALHARKCLARGRRWAAAHWIDHLRELCLSLACDRHGVSTSRGRGVDGLPGDILTRYAATRSGSLSIRAQQRCLVALIGCLEAELGADPRRTTLVRSLERLTRPVPSSDEP